MIVNLHQLSSSLRFRLWVWARLALSRIPTPSLFPLSLPPSLSFFPSLSLLRAASTPSRHSFLLFSFHCMLLHVNTFLTQAPYRIACTDPLSVFAVFHISLHTPVGSISGAIHNTLMRDRKRGGGGGGQTGERAMTNAQSKQLLVYLSFASK